jgi:hypothetical protein
MRSASDTIYETIKGKIRDVEIEKSRGLRYARLVARQHCAFLLEGNILLDAFWLCEAQEVSAKDRNLPSVPSFWMFLRKEAYVFRQQLLAPRLLV